MIDIYCHFKVDEKDWIPTPPPRCYQVYKLARTELEILAWERQPGAFTLEEISRKYPNSFLFQELYNRKKMPSSLFRRLFHEGDLDVRSNEVLKRD